MHGLFAALARTKEYERIGRALDVFSGGRRRGAIGAERVGDAGRRSDERMHRNGLAVFLETDDSWTMIRRVDALRSMGLTGRGHFAKSFGGRLSAAFWRAYMHNRPTRHRPVERLRDRKQSSGMVGKPPVWEVQEYAGRNFQLQILSLPMLESKTEKEEICKTM